MILIYFLYSFPFFILALIILIHINRESQFAFAKNLWLLAVFAITQGIHEMTEMFAGFTEPSVRSLNLADAITLAISFYCLIQFGISTIVGVSAVDYGKKGQKNQKSGKNWRFNLIPLILGASWLIILIANQYNFYTGKYGGLGDVFARYLLGLPGCFLTAYALVLQRSEVKKAANHVFQRSLTMASAGFAFYGLLSGLVVPQASFFPASILNYAAFLHKTGLPVQLARAFAGAFIAYNMLKVIRLFEWEASDAARRENEYLQEKIKERTGELERANSEKETLLRELYHRTKNNMQLISSLIGLQSKYVKDERSLQMLMDSQNRIQAMSMVHEKLYQSGNLSDITVKEYIEELAKALMASYHLQQRVALKLDIDDIRLNIDMAVPCGLIINELMTNSLKYAFPGGRTGEVFIAFHRLNGNKVKLVFADNGTGIPHDFDLTQAKSLGLKLLYNLATKQLHGDVRLDCRRGCRYEITFETNCLSQCGP
ncbi:MAG: sensor histidine kinase [Nitrospiraceae bacterium]|nr:sensor histidine kinase [Nitrospiraceae bacterium]